MALFSSREDFSVFGCGFAARVFVVKNYIV